MATKTIKDPPREYADLRKAITTQYGDLSKKLQQIASFALDHPTQMAMETIASIAKDAGVQPSAIIRFANAFGYTGFSEMQRIFQAHVVERSNNYTERVRSEVQTGASPEQWSNKELLQKICTTNIFSLESLESNIDGRLLNRAIKLIQKADHVYIMGQRRSYPVATYLAYVLNHSECSAHLMDGQGGLLAEQLSVIGKKDVVIGITFHPYASETRNAIDVALNSGAKVVLITDSSLNPMCRRVDICLFAHDAEVLTFRSLTAAMCLAQSLATALAIR